MASQTICIDRLDKMVLEAHVRRTSGSGKTEQEGHGGGHRGSFGDRVRIPQPVKPVTPRERSFWSWPSVSNANPRAQESEGRTNPTGRYGREYGSLEAGYPRHSVRQYSRQYAVGFVLPSDQSDHRNALSPTSRVSPGQRAASRCGSYAIRPGLTGIKQRERQTGYQTKQGQGLGVGRADVPARGMPKGMAEVCP